MKNAWETATAIAAAIIGVAMVAVLVSSRAQTPAVIKSAGDAFRGVLEAATSPVLQ